MEFSEENSGYIQLRIRRLTLFAFIGSLIVHLLVLFAIPQKELPTGETSVRVNVPLTATLHADAVKSSTPSSPPPKPADKQHTKIERVISARTASLTRTAVPQSEPIQQEPAPVDLQAYVAAARAKRIANGMPNSSDMAPPDSRTPSEDEVRMATVLRNLRTGTNGVFQIISVSSGSAAFSFRGWTTDASNARREYIAVELGNNSSIELAIVRKMIELIRRHYDGNFNWESHRLDRVVTLSARLKDTEGLESFLIREFFGSQMPDFRSR